MAGTPWTKEEVELVRSMYEDQHMRAEDIASCLPGRTRRAVGHLISNNKFKNPKRTRKDNLPEIVIGEQYGRLTARSIIRIPKGNTSTRLVVVTCSCNPEVEKTVGYYGLQIGNVKSCGCLRREVTSKKNLTHNQTGTRLYRVWAGMRNRCLNTKTSNYVNYGGRGILLYEEWKKFEPFAAWALENGYADDLSIDRVDVNGHYYPDNCRWVTGKEQQRNRRTNTVVTAWEETKCVAEWAEDARCAHHNVNLLHSRLNVQGWSAEKAISEPVGGQGKEAVRRSPEEVLKSIYRGIWNRCYNPNQPSYPRYGAKGVVMCQEWRDDRLVFQDWALNNGWENGLSIDRVDSNGPYSPSNCRWVTKLEQARNKTSVVRLTAFGETKTLQEWIIDRRCVVNYETILARLKRGWSHEKAVTKPSTRKK